MPRPRFSKELRAQVLGKTDGHCHHCGAVLDTESGRAWHVDHYPVRYADIEDQCGCCGCFVTDPLDPANLVPSCVPCNTSHRYEVRRYCGHSQLRIRRTLITLGAAIAASFGLGVGSGMVMCRT